MATTGNRAITDFRIGEGGVDSAYAGSCHRHEPIATRKLTENEQKENSSNIEEAARAESTHLPSAQRADIPTAKIGQLTDLTDST